MDENGVAEMNKAEPGDPGGSSEGFKRSRFLAAAGGTLFGIATGLAVGAESASAATKYPGSIDKSLTAGEQEGAILAIENALGTNPAGSSGTLAARLETLGFSRGTKDPGVGLFFHETSGVIDSVWLNGVQVASLDGIPGNETVSPEKMGTQYVDGAVGTPSLRCLITSVSGADGLHAPTGKAVEEATSPPLPRVVMPLTTTNPVPQAVITVVAKRQYFARAIIPITGSLRDLTVWIETASGNCMVAIYDPGDANSGEMTRLWQSGSVAVGTGGRWLKVGDPELAVTRGKQVWLCAEFDNSVVTFGRASSAAAVGASVLPENFNIVPGGQSPSVGGTIERATFEMPEKIPQAILVAAAAVPQILGRIS
jgi:hypothetical protein